jgi:hypothetical protein
MFSRVTDGTTELTPEVLQQYTYCMCFQYGTASKAPCLLPVLLYGTRAGNIVLGYADYVMQTCNFSIPSSRHSQQFDDPRMYAETIGDGQI